MRQMYEPFIIRRLAEGRVFFVNAKMPFEFFIDCFETEHPFFLVAELEDGRIAITPNALTIPQNLLRAGFAPTDLLPADFEYVSMKNSTYPVIMTAHPVPEIKDWLKKFEIRVRPFARRTLAEFVNESFEVQPLRLERKFGQRIPEPAAV